MHKFLLFSSVIGTLLLTGCMTNESTVNGEAFLMTVGGSSRNCAGNKVKLRGIYENTQKLYKDSTVCGSDGRFTFNKVPYGKYTIKTRVVWFVGGEKQGGNVKKSFTVNKDTMNIIINDK